MSGRDYCWQLCPAWVQGSLLTAIEALKLFFLDVAAGGCLAAAPGKKKRKQVLTLTAGGDAPAVPPLGPRRCSGARTALRRQTCRGLSENPDMDRCWKEGTVHV